MQERTNRYIVIIRNIQMVSSNIQAEPAPSSDIVLFLMQISIKLPSALEMPTVEKTTQKC